MVKHFIGEQYFTNSFGMKFRLIPAGTFIMGSPKTEEDLDHDEHQHEVTITKSFWMGVNPVTQMQYEKIMGTNPSYFLGSQVQGDGSNYPVKIKSFSPCLHPNVQGDSSNHPVEMVSWDNSVEFCELLSQLPEEKKAGRVYRLPTEAEWEYACRAGTTTTYSFGESSDLLGD
mgnify:CR=1 FL=1